MQLQKQARKASRGKPVRTAVVKLESFNPVVRSGFEIASVTTLHNMEGATHVAVTTQRRVG